MTRQKERQKDRRTEGHFDIMTTNALREAAVKTGTVKPIMFPFPFELICVWLSVDFDIQKVF